MTGSLLNATLQKSDRKFLADRTNSRACATVLRLSSSSVVCSVRNVLWLNGAFLEQKLLLTANRKSYKRNRLVSK